MRYKYEDMQEVFNLAYEGLSQQNWVAAQDEFSGYCMYETSDGLRCAVGHLIPRTKYYRKARKTIGPWAIVAREYPRLFSPGLADFLTDLQDAHDYDDEENEMKDNRENKIKKRMKRVAKKYNLTVPMQDKD